MKGKRTGEDFSKHEVIITDQPGLLVHHFKKPGTYNRSVKFINTNGIMAVTGDWGMYIFYREFHPDPTEGVSDGYWIEKMQIASCQDPIMYDEDATKERLNEMIKEGLESYGYEGKQLAEAKEYMTECLKYTFDEHEYIAFAYHYHPRFFDTELIVFEKLPKYWLRVVFDAFDEICRRMKVGELITGKPDLINL